MNAIAIVIVSAVMLILVILLINLVLKVYDLEKAKANLMEERSKLSDALRRKGIEVASYEKKFKRLEKK